MKFTVTIDRDEDGVWIAECPALPGCVSQGDTKEQALENIKAVLAAAGADMENVVKTLVFLTDVNDFAAMNEVYVTFFPSNPPARSTVGIAKLPNPAALVEIEVIAVL